MFVVKLLLYIPFPKYKQIKHLEICMFVLLELQIYRSVRTNW